MATVFLTGGSGFLGSYLIDALVENGHQVTALTRGTTAGEQRSVTWIRGELDDVGPYRDALATADVVIHAAAVTGKATVAEYHAVNVDGTATLARAAEESGPRRFLFISSVAAGFENDFRYHYAHSKQAAETHLLQTTLDVLIMRPTIIMGPNAPVAAGLKKMAGAPVVPLFGSARNLVQPVHAADLARIIVAALEADFTGQTVTVGGREQLALRDLLGRMHQLLRNRQPRFLPVPMWAVLPPITIAETVAYNLMPITTGQLATFRNPGTAPPHPLVDAHLATCRSVDEMLRDTLLP